MRTGSTRLYGAMIWPALAALACLTAQPAWAADAGWPQWRGPDGQGHAVGRGLPLTWSETENVTWKTELPGTGHSSPVIKGDQVWVTSATAEAAPPEYVKQRLEANTGGQPLNIAKSASFYAICLDKNSGKLIHHVKLFTEPDPQWVHRLNTYASPTPVIEAGRLYCHFGTFGTACLDTSTGKVLWTQRDLRVMHENGPGSSPVLVGDHVVFHLDGSDEQYVAALHKDSGKVAWKTMRSGKMNSNPQLKKAYGTPLVVKVNGRDQLVSTGADWLYGYDPATGKELWKLSYGGLGFSIVPRPVSGHGMVYFSTCYMQAQLLAVRYEGVSKPEIAWRYKRGVSKMPSPILVGDELYFISDSGGLLTCLDAKTGEERYRERLGGNYSASPVHGDGRVYWFGRDGVTKVIQAGPTFETLAENKLDGQIMASPAAINGALFLRTDKAMYRIEDR